MERRELLRTGAVVIATIAVPGCSLFLTLRDPDVTVSESRGEIRFPVARAPWVRDGEGTLAVAVSGRESKILLFRDPAGGLAAVDMTCTHRGCDVAYAAVRQRIECPCHGSKFAPTGEVISGPAPRPLRAYPVTLDGDDVVVRVA